MKQQIIMSSLKNVNVDRATLLDALKKNREKHIIDHEEAIVGWYEKQLIDFKAWKKKVDGLVYAVNKTTDKESFTEFLSNGSVPPLNQFTYGIAFSFAPKPKSYLAEYDRAIKMMEMSVDQTIELDPINFDALVMDNWEWKNDFMNTINTYATSAKK